METQSTGTARLKMQQPEGGKSDEANDGDHKTTLPSTCAGQTQQPLTHLETLGANLKASLRRNIEVIAAVTSQKEIVCPLTLTQESLEQIDNELDAERLSLQREEIVKLRNGSGGNVEANHVFSHALMRAIERDEQQDLQQDQADLPHQKTNVSEKRGKVVGIIGSAGAGKTTLIHQWMKRINNNELFNPTSYVFFIPIDEIKMQDKITLLQFLTSHLLSEWTCSPEEEKQLIEILLKDDDVLIIIDGLDDAGYKSFSSSPSPISIFDTANPKAFVENLLSGNLLPLARKMITFRPGLLHKIPDSLRPPFLVQVQGLNKSSQESLGRKLYKKRYGGYKEILSQNPNLLSYCHIPYNFKLVLKYLKFPQTKQQCNITMTQILTSTLLYMLNSANYASQKDFKLSDVLNWAWRSVKERKSFIKTKDLHKMKLHASTLQKFLNSNKDNLEILCVGENTCHFSSIVWQEFFASLYLMIILSVRDFKSQMQFFSSENLSGVTCFLFGLCHEATLSKLLSVFPKAPAKDPSKKIILLEGLALSVIKERSNSSLLRVCKWICESNTPSLQNSVRNSLPSKINLSKVQLLPWELHNLVYLLQTETTQQLQVLDLSGNDIGDKGSTLLSHCLPGVQELKLNRCGIGRNGARDMSGGISALKSPMKKLSISGNTIGDIGTSFIAECLHCIEDLELVDCGVEVNGTQELTAKILELPVPLKRLDLSWNHLTDTGATVLASCVHKIRKLEVASCGFTSVGRNVIKRRLRSLNLQIFRVVFEKSASELTSSEEDDSDI